MAGVAWLYMMHVWVMLIRVVRHVSVSHMLPVEVGGSQDWGEREVPGREAL